MSNPTMSNFVKNAIDKAIADQTHIPEAEKLIQRAIKRGTRDKNLLIQCGTLSYPSSACICLEYLIPIVEDKTLLFPVAERSEGGYYAYLCLELLLPFFKDKTQLLFLLRKADPAHGYRFVELLAPHLKDHPELIALALRSNYHNVYDAHICFKALSPYVSDKKTLINLVRNLHFDFIECLEVVISSFKESSKEEQDMLIEYLDGIAQHKLLRALDWLLPIIGDKNRLKRFVRPSFFDSLQTEIIDKLLPLVNDKAALLIEAKVLKDSPSLPQYIKRWTDLLEDTTPLFELIKNKLTDEYIDILLPKLNVAKAVASLSFDKYLMARIIDSMRKRGVLINGVGRHIIMTDAERAVYRVLTQRDNIYLEMMPDKALKLTDFKYPIDFFAYLIHTGAMSGKFYGVKEESIFKFIQSHSDETIESSGLPCLNYERMLMLVVTEDKKFSTNDIDELIKYMDIMREELRARVGV